MLYPYAPQGLSPFPIYKNTFYVYNTVVVAVVQNFFKFENGASL